MNFQEIKQVLEENGIVGEKFAYMDENYSVPDDWKASEEVQKSYEISQEAYEKYRKSGYKDLESKEVYQQHSNSSEQRNEEFLQSLGIGEFDVVHEQGDTEGGGDYSCKVFHFKDHDVYIKIEGYYSSYNGTDWNDTLYEVRPTEKKIVVFQ